jgi:NTP pyrophosphatase (non-canonical NTP hydrolase)
MPDKTDAETTIAELRETLKAFVRERDWGQFHSPKNLAMALAAETGELMEHFLWQESSKSRSVMEDPRKAQAIREELADIIIYALEFANATDIDVAQAVREKIVINAQKYPVEKARGTALKYTEL